MKATILLLMLMLFAILVMMSGCEKPTTIKSSQIHYGAITEPRLSSCGIGIKRDQKTGDTVELMYNGKSYVPIEKCSRPDISIIGETGKTYTKWDFDGDGIISEKKLAIRQAKTSRGKPISVNKTGFVRSQGSITQLQMQTINNVFYSDGVSQIVSYYADGSTILNTFLAVKGKTDLLLTAASTGGELWHDKDYYFVEEVTDSVIRAHRKVADELYIEFKYGK